MREIKFRGYNREKKKWVFGSLYKDPQMGYLILEDFCGFMNRTQVVTESVGQFTGCYDRTGLPLYEGDIVEWDENVADGQWRTFRVKVQFVDGGFYPLSNCIFDSNNKVLWMRWIGNVYENKELLED